MAGSIPTTVRLVIACDYFLILLLRVASAISCSCQHFTTAALPFPSGYHSVVDLNTQVDWPRV